MTQLNLSPVDLTLLAVAVNEKIARLDSEHHRLVGLAVVADRAADFESDLDVNRVIRDTYARLVRRIEQALDVPTTDSESLRVALAIERISADFDEEFDREGQPEFNGSFR